MNTLFEVLTIVCSAIVFIILAINKLKVHPFLALILSALFVGFTSGMEYQKIIQLITSGFGGILSGIGIIVVLGTIIGIFIERSGALDVIANQIIKCFGSKYLIPAISMLGALISIPVFCDSGFIILSRLVKKMASVNKISGIPLSLSLGAGLYTTHTLIPPTPGPIAVAGNLAISDLLGLIILTGFLVSVPVLIVSSLFSKLLSKRILFETTNESGEDQWDSQVQRISLIWAVTPVLAPILLITLASVSRLINIDGGLVDLFLFLGNPTIALLLGCLLSMVQVRPSSSLDEISGLFKKGLSQAGPIVLITGAGGAFGSVLKGTDLGNILRIQIGDFAESFPILLISSFVIAALLKTAQGSSTSALVIASAMIAPLLSGLVAVNPFQMTLIVMALGVGAMTISHANDSYFWVVTQFSGMSVKQGYRWFSMLTLLQGLTILLSVLGLYYFSLLFS